MTDLTQQLQAAVGDTYRVERELGGGGMSRVFLAEETALGRRVVIKVLPPELAAGVNAERFRREIQLAASLQHPHIVQLLTAGAAAGLLYYIMPFIPGESLRAKLAREGELPIADAVRILRDVVDALAYAHAQGVVHRDIKPDNVLLAGKHALVTDFGVAKAVSASAGSSTLTSLGLALGTPAYMAPEQGAADPHLDHRADLYAVGVLAYEMLCGRPPFIAPSPQAMLAAHVTMAPEPVTQHRPAVPAALAALVMRCLEKRPADRWQEAEDLLTQLEALATPTGVVPTLAGTPPAALRQGHPLRVTLLFAAGALGVLVIVYALMVRLGLPGWVLGAAVVLLALGLPIMLATARAERQRALLRRGGAGQPLGGLARSLTWRRALGGGAVAFAGLAVVVAVYTALRLLGIGPLGTLFAKGALTAREPIILSDFENHTAQASLGPTVTEAFRVDLSQSPTVKLADAARIAEGLRRMQRDPGTPLTGPLARELAEREGIKAVVTGEIDPVGQGYVLVASVVAARDGAVLTAARATAADEAGLIPALDALSRALRERIGESLTTIRADQPLEQVTTGSFEALQKYTEAVRADASGNDEATIPLLQQATALDTGFAMAYRKLAAMLGNVGSSNTQVIAAATHAFVHRDRLPALERDHATAYYYWVVDYQPAQAIAAYRDVLALDATDHVALNNLAILLTRLRQFSAAESLALRGIATGRCGDQCYGTAFQAEAVQGHAGDAEATLERFARAAPGDPQVLFLRALVASTRFDYAAAERAVHQVRDGQPASLFWQEGTSVGLAELAAVQGHLALAEQHSREATSEAERRGLNDHVLGHAINRGWIDVLFRGRPANGVKQVTLALARHPLDSLPPLDRPYVSLAGFYARAGRPDEARRLLAEQKRVVPEGLRNGDASRHAAAAELAVADGRLGDALVAYEAWRHESGCDPCGLFPEAQVYERQAQPDSAIALYQRLVNTTDPFRLFDADAPYLAAAYKRLGELYEARRDRAQARAYYTRFVDLWKTADPELQPVVQDVRARIARLTSEP
ncbi:MAG TPA: protein kinase [Gemmatimonadales bacterium]|nr:protein kinase [Gemmatimonadales bacterium]